MGRRKEGTRFLIAHALIIIKAGDGCTGLPSTTVSAFLVFHIFQTKKVTKEVSAFETFSSCLLCLFCSHKR